MLLNIINRVTDCPWLKFINAAHCGHPHLEKVGVPGIRKCAKCGHLVDLRPKHWLQRVDEWAGGLGRGTDASARDGIALLLTLDPPPQHRRNVRIYLGG